jgi:hypothetical protein
VSLSAPRPGTGSRHRRCRSASSRGLLLDSVDHRGKRLELLLDAPRWDDHGTARTEVGVRRSWMVCRVRPKSAKHVILSTHTARTTYLFARFTPSRLGLTNLCPSHTHTLAARRARRADAQPRGEVPCRVVDQVTEYPALDRDASAIDAGSPRLLRGCVVGPRVRSPPPSLCFTAEMSSGVHGVFVLHGVEVRITTQVATG